MNEVPDEDLLKRIAGGDASAFALLFAKYKNAVFGLAFHLMGSRMQAEDIAQETWIRVVKNAASFRGGGSARAWVLAISRHLALNSLRQRKWEAELPPENEAALVDESLSFEDLLQSEEASRRLQAALAELPDRQRVALVLYLGEEKSYAAIASELDIEVNAVKALLFRARENLKKRVGEET